MLPEGLSYFCPIVVSRSGKKRFISVPSEPLWLIFLRGFVQLQFWLKSNIYSVLTLS